MRHLKLYSAISFSSFLLCSCPDNTNANGAKDVSFASSATLYGKSAGTDDASFSCLPDGRSFSESGSNGNINAAVHLKDDDKTG
jgi:hypothetical protein